MLKQQSLHQTLHFVSGPMTNNIFFSWNTKKTAQGTFEAIVTKSTSRTTPNEYGLYTDCETLHRAPCITRSVAKTHAQKWVRYFRAQAVEKVPSAQQTTFNR